MEQIIGEIRMFAGDYPPVGWLRCDGAYVSIEKYMLLHSKIQNTYGQATSTTFALPDLRGRIPLHVGTMDGQETIQLGQYGGSEKVSLNESNIPPHTHPVAAEIKIATSTIPDPTHRLATSIENAYIKANGDVTPTLQSMSELSISNSIGGNEPISIVQPFLVITFIIAYEGIY
jgi:microcystin-dependent protein